MPTVYLSPLGGGGAQYLDNSGALLAGGLLYTYTAGTTTPASVYTDNTGNTAHANPIVLDAYGRAGAIWLDATASYKIVLKTSAGVTLWTVDNIATFGPTGITSSAAELNLLDGSIAGTAVSSKALVLGADKNVDTLAIADGGLKLGAGAGTAVTATAAELNILDGVTATAAELNILDGVTATAAELNLLDGSVAGTAVASKALVLDSNKRVDQIGFPLLGITQGSGTASTALSVYEEGNVNLSVDFDTPVTHTVYYTRIGRTVTLFLTALTGAKASGSPMWSTLPASLRPVNAHVSPVIVTDNGSIQAAVGTLTVNTAGTLVLAKTTAASGGWTTTSTVGLSHNTVVTYTI